MLLIVGVATRLHVHEQVRVAGQLAPALKVVVVEERDVKLTRIRPCPPAPKCVSQLTQSAMAPVPLNTATLVVFVMGHVAVAKAAKATAASIFQAEISPRPMHNHACVDELYLTCRSSTGTGTCARMRRSSTIIWLPPVPVPEALHI